jgi:hypothetical protein
VLNGYWRFDAVWADVEAAVHVSGGLPCVSERPCRAFCAQQRRLPKGRGLEQAREIRGRAFRAPALNCGPDRLTINSDYALTDI